LSALGAAAAPNVQDGTLRIGAVERGLDIVFAHEIDRFLNVLLNRQGRSRIHVHVERVEEIREVITELFEICIQITIIGGYYEKRRRLLDGQRKKQKAKEMKCANPEHGFIYLSLMVIY
jgi:hypothetical protein